MRTILKCLVLTTMAVPSFTAYTTDYLITLPGSGVITASQTNFPTLVCANITLGNGNACATITALKSTGNGGSVQSSTGLDIVPSLTACGSPTLLNWELVSGVYSQSTGALEMWVQIPTLSASGTFHLCIGNAAPPSSPGSAWDSNYKGVWHVQSVSSLTDSSASGITGTNVGTTATTGQIDGGAASNGTQWQTYGTSTVLDPAAITFSAWIKGTSFPNGYNSVVSREAGSPPASYGSYTLLVKSSGKLAVYLTDSAGSNVNYDGSGSHTLDSNWHWLAFTYAASGSLIGYVDGASDQTVSATANGLNGGQGNTVYIESSFYASRIWNGSIDEIHIESAARSGAWVAIEYANQSNPATFLTWALQTNSSIRHRVIGGAN